MIYNGLQHCAVHKYLFKGSISDYYRLAAEHIDCNRLAMDASTAYLHAALIIHSTSTCTPFRSTNGEEEGGRSESKRNLTNGMSSYTISTFRLFTLFVQFNGARGYLGLCPNSALKIMLTKRASSTNRFDNRAKSRDQQVLLST
jgi:hypothetical protein